jgi:hypothetical protein
MRHPAILANREAERERASEDQLRHMHEGQTTSRILTRQKRTPVPYGKKLD